MIGFIKKYLLGSNNQGPREAYYLEPDDAKTLGNVDYMREKRVIKRTFPGNLSGGPSEVVKEISNFEEIKLSGKQQESISKPEPSKPTVAKPQEQPKVQRRSGDSSMDMFRNMARGMGKK